MQGNSSSTCYARCVAGFASIAFAVLAAVTLQQYAANTVTAQAVQRTTVLTNYRPSKGCIVRVRQRTSGAAFHYRMCRSANEEN